MCKLEQIAIRLDNDVNGNPRYYFGMFELARLLGVDVDTLEKHRQGLGFTSDTGSKYGYGYIISSEQLEKSLEQKKYILHLALAVEQAKDWRKHPELEHRHPLNICDPESNQYKEALKEYEEMQEIPGPPPAINEALTLESFKILWHEGRHIEGNDKSA